MPAIARWDVGFPPVIFVNSAVRYVERRIPLDSLPCAPPEIGFDSSREVDAVVEMQLRTWARRNYAPAERRDQRWHPIILDEMQRRDSELRHSRRRSHSVATAG